MPQKKSFVFLKGLPNKLTFFRIVSIPVLLFLYPLNFEKLNVFCACLFAIAAWTDFFDGFIARQFKMESKLGMLLDPIADKLLSTSMLVLLAADHTIWPWLVALLLCRDLALSGMRIVACEQGFMLSVSWMGKLKTICLDTAIFCLMMKKQLFGWPFLEVGMISLWLATFLSFCSAFLYSRKFLKNVNTLSSPSDQSDESSVV